VIVFASLWALMALASTVVIVNADNPNAGPTGVRGAVLIFLLLTLGWPIVVFGALAEWAKEN